MNSRHRINFDHWGWRDSLYALQVLPDGKLLIGGKQPSAVAGGLS